jgi:ADP-ribose pyrophosphatase YjhB (NUDIX family)
MAEPYGLIDQSAIGRKNDSLYRLSLKALVINANDEVLVVKESGRTWWDLPGGGMDHDESIKEAIARELFEEVNLSGEFIYQVIGMDEPAFLERANVWQVRIIFAVRPTKMVFSEGVDGDEVMFKDPRIFESSDAEVERRIYQYSKMYSLNNERETHGAKPGSV